MTKNRVRILCIVMVLTMAVLAAVAFADGTQESRELASRNSGSIDITQLEYERNAAGDLIPFSQDQLLIPAVCKKDFSWTEEVGLYGLWNDEKIENVRDKLVFVRNELTSKNVIFRTIIAMEADQTNFSNLIKYNINIDGYDWESGITGVDYGDVEMLENVDINYVYNYTDSQGQNQQYQIKGKYNIVVGTYKSVLEPGKTSAASLLQIAMDPDAKIEQVNQFGDKYEILVWSQAVTAPETVSTNTVAEAFATAGMGAEITRTNHPWITKNTTSGTSAVESGNTSAATDTDVDEKMINNNSN